MFDLIYTPQAESQLRKITFDIYDLSQDVDTAINYVNGIKEKIEEARKNPKAASLSNIPKWNKLGLRKIHYKRYYAYFWTDFENEIIFITAIVFDGMDQEKFLEENI